jgi:hypothetical protein
MTKHKFIVSIKIYFLGTKFETFYLCKYPKTTIKITE